MPPNIDQFNEAVGFIFSDLYSQFPKKVFIEPISIAERLGVHVSYPEPPSRPDLRLDPINEAPIFATLDSGMEFVPFLDSAITWLTEEGFISKHHEYSAYQLTAKALTSMNATPSGLNEPLGSTLNKAVKETGEETRRAVICEVVGQILGAATKGLGL